MTEDTSTYLLEDVRRQVTDGTRARQLLVTLMADYWLAEGALAPSGALVDLMRDFGISESGTRTLLGRLAKEGRLEPVRSGRRTAYRLSGSARTRLNGGLKQIAQFGQGAEQQPQQWTTIAFSVPENRRADRQRLRAALAWLGFAPLYDGVWISPRPVEVEARAAARSLGVEAASVMIGRIEGVGPDSGPVAAWDLERIHRLYEQFLSEVEPLAAMLDDVRIDPALALVRRTELISVWRAYPRLDPELPQSLLPEGWLRRRAQQVFVRVYDGLGSAAVQHVGAAVERHAPEHLPHVAAHVLQTGTQRQPTPQAALSR